MPKNIAIFASGSGSNAENIVNYFKNDPSVVVKLIVASRSDALVLARAERLGIESVVWNRITMNEQSQVVLSLLRDKEIKYVVLAGYLLKVPDYLIAAYPQAIINIHPALLPKYGGKGMYGDNVHKAVVEAKEQESGITVHFVNEHYDEGQIIFQARCEVLPSDDYQAVAAKVHALEYKHFPEVIGQVASSCP